MFDRYYTHSELPNFKMATTVEGAKSSRSSAKAAITRLLNWFLANEETNNLSIFETRFKLLNEAFNKYNQAQDAIEYLVDSNTVEIIDSENRIEIEDRFVNLSVRFQEKIKELSSPTTVSSLNHSFSPQTQTRVRLPEIDINIFNGKISDWHSFSQLFKALIIDDKSLSDVQRFMYLKSYLRNEPLSLIEDLPIDDSSFSIAMDVLKERYESQTSVLNAHFKALFDLQPVSKGSVNQLREFVTSVSKSWKALKHLNYSSDQLLELMVIYHLQKKLDYSVRYGFQSHLGVNSVPSFKQFHEYLNQKCIISENLSSEDYVSQRKNVKSSLHVHTNENSTYSAVKCSFCNESSHKIYSCFKFKNLTPVDKFKFVKSKKMCFNCFNSQHMIDQCMSRHCNICNQKHNTLLHGYFERNLNKISGESSGCNRNSHVATSKSSPSNKKFQNSSQSNAPPTSKQNTTAQPSKSSDSSAISPSCSGVATRNCHVLLGTVLGYTFDSQKQQIPVKVLLDPGSQNSFITESLFKRLGIKSSYKPLNISGIGLTDSFAHKMVNIAIHSESSNYKLQISLSVLPKITCDLPQVEVNVNKLHIPGNMPLADVEFYTPSEIDVLIGADYYYEILLNGIFRLGKNLPILQNTQFGWVVAGNLPVSYLQSRKSTSCLCINCPKVSLSVQSQETYLDQLITNFWTMEEIPSVITFTPEEELAEKIFVSTTKLLENGTFQVNLPLKSVEENIKLGDSFYNAHKRFLNLEKKFIKNSSFFEEYKKFIHEYIQLNHGRFVPLSIQNIPQKKYFFPHHAVVREDKSTTKLRVVFDGSCKTSSGLSLNDIMLKGYQVQPNLFDILCRFRSFKFVLTSDIQKMYRQIRINPDQTFLLNILWRDSPSEPIQCIELLTVTYGTNCAPFLATRVLNEIGQSNKESFPLASEAILNQTYIDDILGGCENITDLSRLYKELNSLLGSHGFQLHKWCSNAEVLMRQIGESANIEHNLTFDKSSTKVLGLKWCSNKDYLSISVPCFSLSGPLTKRKILSIIAQCFDPLGFLSPVIIVGKLLIQSLWLSKVDWDVEIYDDKISCEWKSFFENLPSLNNLHIPRYLFLNKTISKVDIHGFCDASLKAYAACVYFRTEYEDGSISCNLISSKSRVAPLKVISLPRLELCSMVILVKLVHQVRQIFKDRVSVSSVDLWSDSQIALCWIRSHPSRWNIFVSNRVSQIQNLSANCIWRYIPSSQNPADLPTRGIPPQNLIDCNLWWHGPQFLLETDFNLSDSSFTPPYSDDLPDEKRVSLVVVKPLLNPEIWERVFARFSSFLKLQHTIAYCLRFTNNTKLGKPKLTGSLTAEELGNSLKAILRILQATHFNAEIEELKSGKPLSNKNMLSLNPFFDSSDLLLRVGGRLECANISRDQKHPILLPTHNHVVSLMLKYEHERLGHAGPLSVLSNFRLRFWPLSGIRQTKKIVRNCIICFRFRAQPLQQLMASLPRDRVLSSRPFLKVGIDYGGPFSLKSSRIRKAPIIKGYLAIFICMATKALHIEVVTSLSTESFIMTFKRFISRRGNPSVVYSDNATNFLGARNQLKELRDFFKNTKHSDEIKEYFAKNETEFRFIPPRSPHWGGLWEAAVKSVKFHVLRVVGNSCLTYEEFSTVTAQIEAILNSRPISAISNDPSDLECLTPGHFLIGSPITAYPEKDISKVPENRLNFWKRCSQMQQQFWKRWSVDYLNLLQHRPKWLHSHNGIKVNDLVLLKEDNLPPLKWCLGRIVEAMPGKDGHVRVVKVRTSQGIFTRPIVKVCPLPDNS